MPAIDDAYARRIDRFLRATRSSPRPHLAHPCAEVLRDLRRAPRLDLFRLQTLIADPDETVLAAAVALRWLRPRRLLAPAARGPAHREARIRVARRLAESELAAMLRDPGYEVRAAVARRLPGAAAAAAARPRPAGAPRRRAARADAGAVAPDRRPAARGPARRRAAGAAARGAGLRHRLAGAPHRRRARRRRGAGAPAG
ncbi:MAG: hypothetical protein MZW92_59820 [Comamonadaceae bacterium]|nr:hypothetical protein [Comamonadaceae bacterium]